MNCFLSPACLCYLALTALRERERERAGGGERDYCWTRDKLIFCSFSYLLVFFSIYLLFFLSIVFKKYIFFLHIFLIYWEKRQWWYNCVIRMIQSFCRYCVCPQVWPPTHSGRPRHDGPWDTFPGPWSWCLHHSSGGRGPHCWNSHGHQEPQS